MRIGKRRLMKAIKIYAHRGGAGLLPENSLLACRAALALGVDVIDIDVTMTQDNVIVAYHDLVINPDYTKGEVKPVRQLSYQRLKHYQLQLNTCSDYAQQFPYQRAVADTTISSLQTIIQALKISHGDNFRLQIEMKSNPLQAEISAPTEIFVEALVDLLQAENMQQRVEVHSFDWRNLVYLQQIATEICTTYITCSEHADFFAEYLLAHDSHSLPTIIQQLGGKGWCPNYRDIDQEAVEQAHRLGLFVIAWTVDHEPDIQRMIDIGVDGIISNRVDIVRGILAANRYPLPTGVS